MNHQTADISKLIYLAEQELQAHGSNCCLQISTCWFKDSPNPVEFGKPPVQLFGAYVISYEASKPAPGNGKREAEIQNEAPSAQETGLQVTDGEVVNSNQATEE
ncbi:hypothetical protein M758_9G093500 [Ceratodon purpureus]|nr:hypothetical protein M758_9G093500 [Ceratodon purpureus]